MRAAIVAGGLGTRAAGMTADRIPKALLPIGGVPIIYRQLRVLRREGVRRVCVLAGHLGDQLRPALDAEASSLDLALQIIVEPKALGTAGCLTAIDPENEDTLIVYGDMLFDIALGPLQDFHRSGRSLLTMVVHPNDHPRTSDLVVERDGLVRHVLPHGKPRDDDYRNLVPAGIYLASPAFFARLSRGEKADMILDVLPELVAAGERIAAYNTPEYLRDIGSPARYARAERDLASGRVEAINNANRRPAIFFDCDGVLNEEPGLYGALVPDDVKIICGAGAAVRRTRDAGFLAVAVTNRPQVAKGLITCDGLTQILGRLEALLAADGGVLDRVYYCPHHPESGFPGEIPALKISCECRKPGALMLHQAFADLPIDRERSVLVGDSLRDIGAARKAGLWAYGVRTGYGCRDADRYPHEAGAAPSPDLMFETVSEAVDFAISYGTLAAPFLSATWPMLPGRTKPILIGICGRSRSGKSVIAHAIVRALTEQGTTCLVVRLDDWIVPAAQRKPRASAEARNRVEALPDVISALRAGASVTAPGYDAATRGDAKAVDYDPAGRSVIVIEGNFAAHPSIRAMLDLAAFVAAPLDQQRDRFSAFYRWKQFDADAIDALWRERFDDEWPAIDAQREAADLILSSAERES